MFLVGWLWVLGVGVIVAVVLWEGRVRLFCLFLCCCCCGESSRDVALCNLKKKCL